MIDKKNDTAWEKIFSEYKILDRVSKDGHFEISAAKINEFREARLMTKFDHKSNLPKLFLSNNLSILPTSKKGYIIGTFETFCSFSEDNIDITPISFPTFLESLNYRDITSEATTINCAFISKILNDFTNEEVLYPTVSGRMGSSSFNFEINSLKGRFTVHVENSQIEIDGGFEGDRSLNIIEAKNIISTDFIIRQLYYPFRLWSGKINKKIRPIFLTYSNGIFHLREYEVTAPNHYNSLVLVKQKKYAVQEEGFNMEALEQILFKTKSVKEPEIPFPQADSFERVVNLCELIKQNQILTKSQYFEDVDFGTIDPRQHDYYTNAARYLGLVEKINEPVSNQVCYVLSKAGNKIMNIPIMARQREFIKLILSHAIFKKVLKSHLENGEMPNKETIVELMKECKLYNVTSESTYFRRASTVSGWISWIIDRIEE